jgi:hypothetical protein
MVEVTSSRKTGPFKSRKFAHLLYPVGREEMDNEEVKIHRRADRICASSG